MKKILTTLAAGLCCAMTTTVFTACQRSEEETQNMLVGTWTEKNDLYKDVLTLNEDGTFTFQSTALSPSAQAHANLYNGAGYYKNEVLIPSNINLNQLAPNIKSLLHLNYGGKQAQKLEIRKLNNSTLEMTNYNGDIFRFSR